MTQDQPASGHRQQNGLCKKLLAILLVATMVLGSCLVLSTMSVFSQVDAAGTQETAVAENLTGENASIRTLDFLTGVLAIELSSFNVSIQVYDMPDWPFTEEQKMPKPEMYTLQSSQQKIDMVCGFNNGILTQCNVYLYPEAVASPSNSELKEKALDFLQKYQAYSGVDCAKMMELLSRAESVNTVLYLGNLTLTVSTMELTGGQGSITSFSFATSVNGCDYKGINFDFKNGVFHGMCDKTSLYSIGDTTVNLSRKQAVDIAMNAIQNYSYKMTDDYWVSDFKIAGNDANLIPVAKDDVLYPCWQVKLFTDGVYPGSVHGLLVHVWAGSGEVRDISNIAYSTPTDYLNRADI